MLVSPINRSRRSDNLASCATAPRQRRGQRNGRMPSRTSKRQHAMPNSCHMIPTDAKKPRFPRLPNHTTLIATSHKPQATSFKLQAKSDAYLQLMACSLTLPLGLGLFQITEEVTARIEHQHITLIREALTISLQAAIERVELLILAIRLGVDGRCLGIAIAAQLFRLAVGISQQHAALTIGVGTNTFGQ